MAQGLVAPATAAQVNGHATPSAGDEDEEEFYTQLLQLRDAVIAGSHPQYKLPASAVEQLKASLIVPQAQPQVNGVAHGSPSDDHTSTNPQSMFSAHTPTTNGYHTNTQTSYIPPLTNKLPTSSGFDSVLLTKSDGLVRAEGVLKRQRIERDLRDQVDQRKYSSHHSSRDGGTTYDGPPQLPIDEILTAALQRVKPVSGLRVEPKTGRDASGSFDTNDYYSSQVQSDWSSEASATHSQSSQGITDPVPIESMYDAAPTCDAPSASFPAPTALRSGIPQASQNKPHFYTNEPEGVYEPDDEDEEYSPPDATAFDSFQQDDTAMEDLYQGTPPPGAQTAGESGEITEYSNAPTPQQRGKRPAPQSPQVPIIRNHLTHIAAPQPNRVSPLAVQKGPSIELELVNGCPQVVQKPQPQAAGHARMQHRDSSGSPDHTSRLSKKELKKKRQEERLRKIKDNKEKRKREGTPLGRPAKRSKYAALRLENEQLKAQKVQKALNEEADDSLPDMEPPSGARRGRANEHYEPYIKPEPVSPPPFMNLPEMQPVGQGRQQYRPAEIDLVSPRRMLPPTGYAHEPAPPVARYEYARQASPTVVRVDSPSSYRPVQRDTQDLRRVASMHYAQRPASPPRQVYSPVGPYRTASMTYGEPRQTQVPAARPVVQIPRYVVAKLSQFPGVYHKSVALRLLSMLTTPSRYQDEDYESQYAPREASPALMPPPAAPPRRIVVDQYGNRYYAAEAAPPSRASVAPVARRPEPEISYERAPSRQSVAYIPQQPQYEPYNPADNGMPPPPPPRRQVVQEPDVEYIDAGGYRQRAYSTRPEQPVRYAEQPTSPVYQYVPQQTQMPPPPPREPTSPVYAPRSYSVRPEAVRQEIPPGYVARQASVAPVQYVRYAEPAPPPMRAVSMVPGSGYGDHVQQRAYSYAPQPVQRYVDEHGTEVPMEPASDFYARPVRQASVFRYE